MRVTSHELQLFRSRRESGSLRLGVGKDAVDASYRPATTAYYFDPVPKRARPEAYELPGRHPLKNAHADLDAAVLDAYGISPKKDLLSQLLELNLSVAAAEKAGTPVTP